MRRVIIYTDASGNALLCRRSDNGPVRLTETELQSIISAAASSEATAANLRSALENIKESVAIYTRERAALVGLVARFAAFGREIRDHYNMSGEEAAALHALRTEARHWVMS